MTSANSDIHCQLTSSIGAVTREDIFGTWIFARLLTQADVRVLKSAWIVALEFGCSWDWRRDHCIMHTCRCGQAPFLFIWSCRRKVVETRKSRIRAYPWIVVWSCSCSTPQYSANRSIRKQHQKTSLDRGGTLSRFFSGTIWAPPCTLPKKASRDNIQQGGTPAIFFSGLIQALSPMDRNTALEGVQNQCRIEPTGVKNGAKRGPKVAFGHPKIGPGVEFEMEPQIWCQKNDKP